MKKSNSCFSENQKLTSLHTAQRVIARKANKINNFEVIRLENSEGRILAENLISDANIPNYNNAAVDGFAFNFNELKKNIKKNNRFLKNIGSSRPGKPFLKRINSGESIEIFTGSYLISKTKKCPDTVVMRENCKIKDNMLSIIKIPKKGANIRLMGEDIKKGKVIMKKGEKIRPVDLGFISSIGVNKLKVYKKIKVGIFSSGNELSINSMNKAKYKIFDSNKITLITLLKKLNCEVIDMGIIEDNYKESEKKLNEAASISDLIITTGGVAGSKSDLIVRAVNNIGELNIWKLAIKPGRPLAFGNIKGKPFFGLPGNPVAVVVTFFMIILNFLQKVQGRNKLPFFYNLIPSNFSFSKKEGRTEWLRGSTKLIEKKIVLEKYKSEGSGILSSISQSDGIIELEEEKKFIKKGELLKFYKFGDFLN